MSRQLRKVPKGWEHPKKEDGKYMALHEYNKEHQCNCDRCEVNSDEYYMPKIDGEFGYALYEEVSEGTPITPVFSTKEEVSDYLVKNGDFWGYKWSEQSAKKAVEGNGYTLSGLMMHGKIYQPHNMGDIGVA